MAGSIALTEKRSRRAEIQALREQRRHTIDWLTELYNGKPFLKGERTYSSGTYHIQYSTEKQRESHSSTIGFATPVPHCNFNLIQYGSMDRPDRETFPKGRNSSPLGIAAPDNRLTYRTIQQTVIPKGRKNLPFRSRPPFKNRLPAILF